MAGTWERWEVNNLIKKLKQRDCLGRPGNKLLTYWPTYLLTYSMEQSSSEPNRFSAGQEIPRILWNPKVHYRIHKCPPPAPVLSSSIQSIPAHPTSWRSILILSSHLRLGLPSGLLPSGLPTKTLYASPLPHTGYIPRQPHSSRSYHPNNIGWAVLIIKLLITGHKLEVSIKRTLKRLRLAPDSSRAVHDQMVCHLGHGSVPLVSLNYEEFLDRQRG